MYLFFERVSTLIVIQEFLLSNLYHHFFLLVCWIWHSPQLWFATFLYEVFWLFLLPSAEFYNVASATNTRWERIKEKNCSTLKVLSFKHTQTQMSGIEEKIRLRIRNMSVWRLFLPFLFYMWYWQLPNHQNYQKSCIRQSMREVYAL